MRQVLLVIVLASTACGASAAAPGPSTKGEDSGVSAEASDSRGRRRACAVHRPSRCSGDLVRPRSKRKRPGSLGRASQQRDDDLLRGSVLRRAKRQDRRLRNSGRDVSSDRGLRHSRRRAAGSRRRLPSPHSERAEHHRNDDASACAPAERGAVAAGRRTRVEDHGGRSDAARRGRHGVQSRHRGLHGHSGAARRVSAARERPELRRGREGRRHLRARAVRVRAVGQGGDRLEEQRDATSLERRRVSRPRGQLPLRASERRPPLRSGDGPRLGGRSNDSDRPRRRHQRADLARRTKGKLSAHRSPGISGVARRGLGRLLQQQQQPRNLLQWFEQQRQLERIRARAADRAAAART